MKMFHPLAINTSSVKSNNSFYASSIFTLMILLIMTSCNSQNRNTPVKKNPNVVTANSNRTVSSQKFIEGKDYTIMERVRVLDNIAFTQPVEAYSMLVPTGWKSNGEIWWATPGDVGGGVNTKFKTTSSDGQYSLEIFPAYLFAYSTDPQMNEIMRNSQNELKGFGQPLDAANYFKQVFVNTELGGASVTEIKPNPDGLSSISEKMEESKMELTRYGAVNVQMYPSAISGRVKFKDGSEGIVLCGVMITEGTIPNIYDGTSVKNYTTNMAKRIVFKYPANEYEKASKIMSTIMSSYRTNIPWQNQINSIAKQAREQSNRRHIDRIRLTDEQTRQMGNATIAKGNQNLANMDTRMRNWEQSQASQDRINTNFIKTIREVETYRDGTGVVELNSGYNHAWSRSDGSNFILSDNPNFNPSSVLQDQQWKEMKKVDN